MPDSVRVITGARIHLGLLPDDPRAQRRFGGAGLMVHRPGFDLTVSRARNFSCTGTPTTRDRIWKLVQLIVRSHLPPGSLTDAVAVTVAGEIPAHVGLGSGTQLSLAIAQALARLAGVPAPDPVLGYRLGRGARSLLGIFGFAQGGMLIDAARSPEDAIFEPTARIPFPEEWRLLLITPAGTRGLSGSDELNAFERLPPMSRMTGDRLRHILWDELLPAVREANFDRASSALWRFGLGVGESFAAVQGGTYASPLLGQLVERVRSRGVEGVGQSSWGPTLFALCENATHAEAIRSQLLEDSLFAGSQLTIAKPLNEGAKILVHD